MSHHAIPISKLRAKDLPRFTWVTVTIGKQPGRMQVKRYVPEFGYHRPSYSVRKVGNDGWGMTLETLDQVRNHVRCAYY